MDKIIDMIKDSLNDFISIIADWLMNWLIQDIAIPMVHRCRNFGEDVFSGFINSAITVLQKSPSEWNSDGWEFILQNVNTVFIAFGCQLVVLFFLIGFLSESIDPRQDIRLETMIKALFKVLLAEFLVCNSANIVTGLFQLVTSLTSGVTTSKYQVPTWKIVDGQGTILEQEFF